MLITEDDMNILAEVIKDAAPPSFKFLIKNKDFIANRGIEWNFQYAQEGFQLLNKEVEYEVKCNEVIIPISLQLYENERGHWRLFSYTRNSGMLFSINFSTAPETAGVIPLQQTIKISTHRLEKDLRLENTQSLIACLLSEEFNLTHRNKITLGYFSFRKGKFIDTSAEQFIKDFIKVAVIKGHFMGNKGYTLRFLDEEEIKPELEMGGEPSIPVRKAKPVIKPALGADLEQKYEILEAIGGGGFADVYKARRKQDSFTLALKLPRIKLYETVTPDSFFQEAELWSKLSHPHIVKVYEYGTKPIPWIAMEYMEGGSLRGRIGRLSVAESLQIGTKLAEALYYASHLGVIHRDIKPENVLFDLENTPKLTDWGLGKMMIEASQSVSGFMGTIAYAAPEQLSAKFGEADWQTDIYQLGVMLYEMLTGELLFGGDLGRILSEEPATPLHLRIPEELDKVIRKAIAKRKEERYQDISAFKEQLEMMVIRALPFRSRGMLSSLE